MSQPELFASRADPEAVGLTSRDAEALLAAHGPNALPDPPRVSLGHRIFTALREPLVLVLLAAMVLTIISRDVADTVIIALVVLVNTTLAVQQEVRSERDARALASLVSLTSRALRDGRVTNVPSTELVPGDLVLLRTGDMVPADCRLVEAVELAVDESALTGESLPVEKEAGGDPDHARLSSGTAVLQGRGRAVVTATGADSALGRIAGLLTSKAPATPLQRRMSQLSLGLAVVVVLLCGLVLALGLLRGQPWESLLLSAVSLAVAAVPESLPAVVAITLALAARRMATRHAVVRRLAAVETLGSVTLLATDKTGTLTEGVMRVSDAWVAPGASAEELWSAVALCNDAELAHHRADDQTTSTDPGEPVVLGHGDPMELALLTAATDAGVDVHSVRQSWPRVAEQGFDRVRRSMTVTCRSAEGTRTVRKGAPEVILDADLVDATPTVLQSARRRSAELAADGARVLAVAGRHEPERAVGSVSFELLGLVALRDPARASAAHTVAACHDAGMQLVLMTGDHPGTAAAIAREVGIRGDDEPGAVLAEDAVHGSAVGAVIARATPEDKVAMVRRWRGDGHVVAMTGDGVNDGPALHEADVGVAMGRRGTEVARQAADLILTDDDLQTIVAAVEEGRRDYANVRRFLLYGLAGGASEILAMLLGPFIGLTVPLLAGQLLWVNIVTHSFAGTALGVEPAESGSMQKRPRSPEQAVLGAGLWWRIVLLSAVLAGVGFAAALLVEPDSRQTALMLVLGSGQLGIAWGVRTRGLPSDVTRRPLLPLTLVGAAMLLALGALVPLLNLLLGTVWPDPVTWVYAAVAFCVLALATRAVRPQAF